MKILAVILKGLRQQWRDRLSLALTSLTPPFFVFFYWLFFSVGGTGQSLLVLNLDEPVEVGGTKMRASDGLVLGLKQLGEGEDAEITVEIVEDRARLEQALSQELHTVGVIIEPDFTRQLVTPVGITPATGPLGHRAPPAVPSGSAPLAPGSTPLSTASTPMPPGSAPVPAASMPVPPASMPVPPGSAPMPAASVRPPPDMPTAAPSTVPAAPPARPSKPAVVIRGSADSPDFIVVSALVRQALQRIEGELTGQEPRLTVAEEPTGSSEARTAFDRYVPGLLVFSVIMLIFSVSMAMAREMETGMLTRLKMTRLSAGELLVGMGAVQLLVGIITVVLTFATALVLGFRSQGSLALAIGLSVLACVASVGVGLVVASLSRSITRAFLISSSVMFLLVLFSGMLFPRPAVPLGTVAGKTIDLFHLLPTALLGSGLSKVLALGSGWSDVSYEAGGLALLSLVAIAFGIACFKRYGGYAIET